MTLQKRIPLVCPACEIHPMQAVGMMQARCSECGFTLGGEMLKTILGVLALPEVLGAHTCEECGHPQMRRLPDGVFHCPACCAEVTPVVR
jgi:ribosomal protein L37AE/L43A